MPRSSLPIAAIQYSGPKLHDVLQDLGVSQLIEMIEIVPKSRGRQGIYGLVASLGGGTDLRVDGSLPSSRKGCGEDGGEFTGLDEAGCMPVHDAEERSAPEVALFFRKAVRQL